MNFENIVIEMLKAEQASLSFDEIKRGLVERFSFDEKEIIGVLNSYLHRKALKREMIKRVKLEDGTMRYYFSENDGEPIPELRPTKRFFQRVKNIILHAGRPLSLSSIRDSLKKDGSKVQYADPNVATMLSRSYKNGQLKRISLDTSKDHLYYLEQPDNGYPMIDFPQGCTNNKPLTEGIIIILKTFIRPISAPEIIEVLRFQDPHSDLELEAFTEQLEEMKASGAIFGQEVSEITLWSTSEQKFDVSTDPCSDEAQQSFSSPGAFDPTITDTA